MDKKQVVLDFIKRNHLTVISTISPDGKPQAAVIEYGETDDLELIIDTFNTSRKYKNLKQNPLAAFVIGWDENITVQYEGVATELEGEEKERYKKFYFNKTPDAKRWEEYPEISYFKIAPKWIRYSDLTSRKPSKDLPQWNVFELEF